MQKIFEDIYKNNIWGGSGSGSHLQNCLPLIEFLKLYLVENNIISLVDIGCGDFQWMPVLLSDTDVKYTGIDIVSSLIEVNSKKFPQYEFIHIDAYNKIENLPPSDLYLIKDVIQHWPSEIIVSWLDSFFYKYPNGKLITVNCCNQISDVRKLEVGGGEPLSMSYYPLNLYSPKLLLHWYTKECLILSPRTK